MSQGHLLLPDPDAPSAFAMTDPGRIRELVVGAGFAEPEIEEVAFRWLLAPHLLTVNLGNSEGAVLAGFARRWAGRDPTAGVWVDFEDAPECLEPNIQIRREFAA